MGDWFGFLKNEPQLKQIKDDLDIYYRNSGAYSLFSTN